MTDEYDKNYYKSRCQRLKAELTGRKTRAQKLTSEQRTEIARLAAKARWSSKDVK